MSMKRYDKRPQSLLDTLQNRVRELENRIKWTTEAAEEQIDISNSALRQHDIYMRDVEKLKADLEEHQAAIDAIIT